MNSNTMMLKKVIKGLLVFIAVVVAIGALLALVMLVA